MRINLMPQGVVCVFSRFLGRTPGRVQCRPIYNWMKRLFYLNRLSVLGNLSYENTDIAKLGGSSARRIDEQPRRAEPEGDVGRSEHPTVAGSAQWFLRKEVAVCCLNIFATAIEARPTQSFTDGAGHIGWQRP